jgi:hypothetical protein
MIARFDFPRDWPELLTTLIPLVGQSFSSNSAESILIQQNTLYTLHLCVKQIASKALPAARKTLRDAAPDIFQFMLNIFNERVKYFADTPLSPENYAQLDCNLSLARIALKCMRRLIVHGFNSVLESPVALSLLSTLYQYLPRFMEAKLSLPDSSFGLSKTLSSISILAGKLYLDLEDGSVTDFVLSPGCLDAVKFYWQVLKNSTEENNSINTLCSRSNNGKDYGPGFELGKGDRKASRNIIDFGW